MTLLEGDIFRIFLWKNEEDEQKKSVVLKQGGLGTFDLRRENDSLFLSGNSERSLRIDLKPFSWDWDGVRGGIKLFQDERTGQGLVMVLEEGSGRRYYGLGERVGRLNKKGRIWTNWNTDPKRGVRLNTDPLYQSHPFLIGVEEKRAFGLYLDESWETRFDLAASSGGRSKIATCGPTFDLYLIPGPSIKEVVRRFTTLSGKAPLPPLWAFGYHQCRWGYKSEKFVGRVVQQFRKYQIPLESIWLDIDYMRGYRVFSFDERKFPDPKRMIKRMRDQNIRTVVIVDPGVKFDKRWPVFKEGLEKEAFLKKMNGEIYVGKVWPGNTVFPDFSRDDVRKWWGEKHRFYLKNGVAGIWNDMNEPTSFSGPENSVPFDTLHSSGTTHAKLHNLYGYYMNQACFEALKRARPRTRPFILTRSGFSGVQKFAWVWTGDNRSDWKHLSMSIPMLLNLGLSGVPFVGADIGGFGGDCDGELFARWMWLGAFYPFMRNHSSTGTIRQEPWCFGRKILRIARDAIRFRYRLLPYLYTVAEEACRTGIPVLRPLCLEYPDDEKCAEIEDEFLLGNDLLVAPALKKNQKWRRVYLPEGQWEDFWSGSRYLGQKSIRVDTPLESIPLFLRAGAAVPLTEASLNTKRAVWKPLIWRVSLAERVTGRVYEDEGEGFKKGRVRKIRGSFRKGTLKLTQGKSGTTGKVFVLIGSGKRYPLGGRSLVLRIREKKI
ncbi:MAG: alpha-glucosidase [Candidatus Hydrogenedentota bacterium]|nr:MAG: alpha-glucosidase [Candidatus Hydrogenedentota bacterium]